jgi:murein DD-endopeptidase MepM/ murein hydrolase activator NlpD
MLPQPFGNARTYPGHSGVDYPQASGTLIRASGPGRVTSSGYINSRAGYGVIVAYDGGPAVLYCHQLQDVVRPPVGARVGLGGLIGQVGSTGNSTGPHLHVEISSGAGAHTYEGVWLHFSRTAVVAGGSGGNATSRPTADIQRLVGVTPDGIYGPATIAAVKAWQARNGLTADGVWGPKSDAVGFPGTGGLAVDGKMSPATIRALQAALGVAVDGKRGPVTIRAEQRLTGARVDGIDGPETARKLQSYLNTLGYGPIAEDGKRGPLTIRALQRALNDGRFGQ